MNTEKFFKEMYRDIWQSKDLSQFERYYSKDFEETISVSDENKNPLELHMNYQDLLEQAKWQKENYKDTTIDIKKLVASGNDHISVYFYSTSIEKRTGEIKHRCVCGIWRLNKEKKIDRVWAVVTPYYPQ
ncbi:MAG TPA: hypothetical protein VLG76_01065 [Rhabdochlamydiaceae bacterium]|nr:hypothetical protein [Rhabdochlamydiaceae bacterium]